VSEILTLLLQQFCHSYASKVVILMYKRDMGYSEENKDFCTIKEAARLSGLALKTWYHGGGGTANVPRIRFGRSVRLLRKDVEHFINERINQAEVLVRPLERDKI
jgi:predicted DNA-binding transcriptional regulator AlpA